MTGFGSGNVKSRMFEVRITQDARAKGLAFGPFTERRMAESCVIALASRNDILAATIEEIEEESYSG